MGPSRTVSEIRAIFAKHFHPMYLTPPLRGSPWNTITTVGSKKLEWCRYIRPSKNCGVMSIRLDTIPALNGQTDRIGKTISRSACWRAIKNRVEKQTTLARSAQQASIPSLLRGFTLVGVTRRASRKHHITCANESRARAPCSAVL